MNILVLGGGGREHAIVWALLKSPQSDTLYVAPGNGGTRDIAQNVEDLNPEDAQAVCAFALSHAIGLVVIGPEAPLVAGVADVLRRAGLLVFGPDAQGALLEGSKTYSKEFMQQNNIPTAYFKSFTDFDQSLAYVNERGLPIVIKADGLAAGKGVVVAQTMEEAKQALHACFDGSFGQAGKVVVIEECLRGYECSLLAFVAKGHVRCMACAQDHKRILDGDKGSNTGGMGAYSPVSLVSDDDLQAMESIMDRAGAATARPPFTSDYRGVLYGGFMVTDKGPKVIEFNVRFGDPETQVVLPRLKGDLLSIMIAVARGNIQSTSLDWSEQCAVCVVLASEGYPGAYKKGKVIEGLDKALALEGVVVFHAGTTHQSDGSLVTAGGRVLDVVGLGETLRQARERAYAACDCISFEGKQLRSDIGGQALNHQGVGGVR